MRAIVSQYDTNVKPLAEHLRDAVELNKALPGESHLWTFTRCAKGHSSLAGLDAESAANRVEEALGGWHKHFPGVPDCRFEFIECWARIASPIRNPANYSYMVNALRLADSQPLEVKAPTEGYRRFLSYSYHLQRMKGDASIFLPLGRTATILFGQDTPAGRKMISRYRQRALQDGWLRQTANYTPRKLACEYRFVCDRIDPQTRGVRKPILLTPRPCQVETLDMATKSRNRDDVTQDIQLIPSRNTEESQERFTSRSVEQGGNEPFIGDERNTNNRTSPPAQNNAQQIDEIICEIPRRDKIISLSSVQQHHLAGKAHQAGKAGSGLALGSPPLRQGKEAQQAADGEGRPNAVAKAEDFSGGAVGLGRTRTRWVSVEPPPRRCRHCDRLFQSDDDSPPVRVEGGWAHTDCDAWFRCPPPDSPPPSDPVRRGLFDSETEGAA